MSLFYARTLHHLDGAVFRLSGVVASNYGQDRHPGWYHNLKANPLGRVTVDGVTREIEAYEVTDLAERERLFAMISRAVIMFDAYCRHTERVGREIPILRLRPVAARS
jgi:deazaflavin-dependent oxidoreductase (nitroreductase family)